MLKITAGLLVSVTLFAAVDIPVVRHDGTRLAPRLINYQGFLTDTLGDPTTNPTISMTFGIWNAAAGGSQQWFENQSVAVSRGVFHAVLGTVTPIPDSVFTKGTDRWLELTVAGITLNPRTRITSAAYAYSATHSDTAQYAKAAMPIGPAGGDLAGSYPGPAIADKAVTTAKLLDTAVTMTKIAPAGATAGQVIKWNGNAWQPAADVAAADSDWIFSGNHIYSGAPGNVGIGTSSPLNKLTVSGVICGGTYDTVQAPYGGILAGYDNQAGDDTGDTAAVVTGGRGNLATGKYSVVAGGRANAADNSYTAVGGGYYNLAGEIYATVGGGYADTASAMYSTVAGGRANQTSDWYAAIGGGAYNSAAGYGSAVGGGYYNASNASYTALGGGYYNAALGNYSTVGGGRRDTVLGHYGGAFSGYMNIAGDATSDTAAVILGGFNNLVTGRYSLVGGGRDNEASAGHASVLGGRGNHARGDYATIGGGIYNYADSIYSTVGGGGGNYARGIYGTVSGGTENYASNYCATVPGGSGNRASGMYSFAAGRNATAPYPGTFVWADALNDYFAAQDTNQFVIRARGGVGIGTDDPQAQLDVAGDVRVTGAIRGNLGPGNGGPFPRPAYDSGWRSIATGDTLVLTHGLGGNVDNYVVDMQFKDSGTPSVNILGYGLESHASGSILGAYWRRLNASTITLVRGSDDNWADQIRIRIWVVN